MVKSIVKSLAVLALLHVFASPALALDKPTGDVILTIKGKLEHPNVGDEAQFDLQMLESLPGRKASMETPWTEGSSEFSGPLLAEILKAAGATGTQLSVIALNDYAADVPMEDATGLKTILATRMNGTVMSVRDKGPLFLIYPFDLDKNLYNEKYFSRSVWQIKEIDVK